MKLKNLSTRWLVLGSLAAVIGLFLLARFTSSNSSSSFLESGSTRDLALSCTTDMATKFHIHPRISIVVQGAPQEISANLGIKVGCMNPLHTHDTSGVIHVEAPTRVDFTLGDFFAVWGEPFNRDGYSVKMTVNGNENTELENLVLRDKDQIMIIYEAIN